jgi:hypothetical protein
MMLTARRMIVDARRRDLIAEVASRGASLTFVGGEWIGPCPVCGGHDRFSISIRKRLFNCRGCRVGGDVIRLIQHLEGCDFATAVMRLAGVAPLASDSSELLRPRHSSRLQCSTKTTTAALAIWEQAHDPRGTAAEQYLNRRGLQISSELACNVVRFHDALHFDGHRVPGLVALFRDILTDEPAGIQRVFLQGNGERIGRRMLGRARGAAIKLDADGEVCEGLHIGEGLETCMAARTLGFKPVWAVGSAGAIGTFPVLPGIGALSIFLESDDQGANAHAARACAKRWLTASREVLAIMPLFSGDMNDVALRCGYVG